MCSLRRVESRKFHYEITREDLALGRYDTLC